MSWANPKAFNFRATSGFVTDGTNETYVIADSYPTTRTVNGESVTFGWETSPSGSRDRDNSTSGIFPELSGINFNNSASTDQDFRVDLPASGTYTTRLALGDAGGTNIAWLKIVDTTTVLTTLGNSTNSISAANFVDASGTTRTSGTDWQNNNASISSSFSTTIARFRLPGGAGLGQAAVFAHVKLTPPAGGTTFTLGGQAITSAEGAPTATVSYALSGQSVTSAEGTPTPAISYGLFGQVITSAEGAITAAWSGSASLVGQQITSALGTITPEIDYSIAGQAITSAEGAITAATGGDVTLSLAGLQASFTLGQITVTGADVAAQTGAGSRRRRQRFFVEIDGKVFWCRSELEAERLLLQAREIARALAEKPIAQPETATPAKAPTIVYSRSAPPEVRQMVVETRREIKQIFARAKIDYELYQLLTERIRLEDDEEAILLL